MTDREKIAQIREVLKDLKALALEQDEQTLCYLIQVAEMEAEDVLSGRFTRGSAIEAFSSTHIQ